MSSVSGVLVAWKLLFHSHKNCTIKTNLIYDCIETKQMLHSSYGIMEPPPQTRRLSQEIVPSLVSSRVRLKTMKAELDDNT